jgi:hypothetical protein
MEDLADRKPVIAPDRPLIRMTAQIEVPLPERIVHFRQYRAQALVAIEAEPETDRIESMAEDARQCEQNNSAISCVDVKFPKRIPNPLRGIGLAVGVVPRPQGEQVRFVYG